MLLRELEVFIDIYVNYQSLQQWLKGCLLAKDRCERELVEVTKSEQETYGLFGKLTKQQKMEQLENMKKFEEENALAGE